MLSVSTLKDHMIVSVLLGSKEMTVIVKVYISEHNVMEYYMYY